MFTECSWNFLQRQAFAKSAEHKAALAAPTVEQITKGKLLTPPSGLHPDHIVSIQKMTEMECFGKLTYKERNYLATMRENLVAMDESANLSKQERSWAEWKQAARALRLVGAYAARGR